MAAPEPDEIGKRLAHAIAVRGTNVNALAKRAKVPQSTLAEVIAGRREGRNLKAGHIKQLALALQVTTDWILGLWAEDAGSSRPRSPEHDLLPGPGDFDRLIAQRTVEALRKLFPPQALPSAAQEYSIDPTAAARAAALPDAADRGGAAGP